MNKPAYTLIFGLTADPIHKGHEQVILNSFTYAKAHQLSIKDFILVPTYQPNLIADKQQPRTPFNHRFKMCQIIVKSIKLKHNYPIHVSDIEEQIFKETSKKSFSYDTLKAIDAPNKLFVLSADHFAGRWPKFRKWSKWQELVKENGLLIHQRPGHGINKNFIHQLKNMSPNIHVITDLPLVDISSTQIRNQLINVQNESFTGLCTAINQYIQSNCLYVK